MLFDLRTCSFSVLTRETCGLGLGLGLETCGLGLGLETCGLGLGLGLEASGLGLGLGLAKMVLLTSLIILDIFLKIFTYCTKIIVK